MNIRLPSRRHWAATVLVLLLLVLRLAVPAYALSAGTAGEDATTVLGTLPICHADAGPAGKPVLPSAHDCLFCPVCQLAATPALLPTASWVPAPPQAALVQAALPPSSTGPPPPARYAAPPRGPPASAV